MSVRRLSVALSVAALVSLTPASAFAEPVNPKIDRGLRERLTSGAPTQNVIVSVKEGCRDFVRTSLQKHGDPIRSEHVVSPRATDQSARMRFAETFKVREIEWWKKQLGAVPVLR